MQFYLGTHQVNWLRTAQYPLMVSARRLRRCVGPPRAACEWVLDSGGFSELSLHGWWTIPAMQYSTEVRYWRKHIGNLEWAAPQDWMCEPHIVAKTGLSVREHQRQTVANFRLLRQLAPDLPWIPVIQGFALKEYLECVQRYGDAGIDLTTYPIVGVGSVCRRQGTGEADEIFFALKELGIRSHGFGLKLTGLKRSGDLLASADSMAWSFNARKNPPLPGCTHKNCNSCIRWATQWRERVMRSIAKPQAALFDA